VPARLPWLAGTDRRHVKDRSASKVPYPCEGWNEKHESVRQASKGSRFKKSCVLFSSYTSETLSLLAKSDIRNSHMFLLLAWALLAFTTWRVSSIESDTVLYDPFQILGISSVSRNCLFRRFLL
jgi:preprotein translocase subunit Sec63